jgi:hypothetical protein
MRGSRVVLVRGRLKTKAEHFLSIDVRRWAREGRLVPDSYFLAFSSGATPAEAVYSLARVISSWVTHLRFGQPMASLPRQVPAADEHRSTPRKHHGTMKNVEMTVEANILTIKVDLSKEVGPSSSGKTIIIASTEGNVPVDGAEKIKVGLNVYKKKN